MEYVRKRKMKKLKKLVQFNMAGFEVLKNMEYLRKRKRKKLEKLVQFSMAGLEEDTKAQLKMACSI